MARYDETIIALVESTARNFKALPLNLGAVQGSGGGVGAPPGGYIGWLPQTRVAYDIEELETLATSVSGSLLDNLNHIRYRLGTLESGGSIIITDDNNTLSYLDTTNLHFVGSGVIVTDLGGGEVQVQISATGSGGGGLDETTANGLYLRLDTANNPLTGPLEVIPAANENGIYVEVTEDGTLLDLEQYVGASPVGADIIFGYQEATGAGDIASILLDGVRWKSSTGIFTGDWIYLEEQGVERFSVDSDGNVNVASGCTYNINNIPIIIPPTSAIGVALTDNTSGGGTTDVINAINPATVDASAAKLTDVRDALHQLTIKINKIHDWAVSMGLEDV